MKTFFKYLCYCKFLSRAKPQGRKKAVTNDLQDVIDSDKATIIYRLRKLTGLLNYKTLLPAILLITFSVSVSGQGSGYVTLRGKQFYDQDGKAFYPMVLNYEVNLAHINNGTNPSDFLVAPSCSYGTTNDYENNSLGGAARMLIDFKKIKSMGFNSIRLVGIYPNKLNGPGFHIVSHHYPNTYPPETYDVDVEFNPPYEDPYSNTKTILISNAMRVLDLADSAGLKVILESAGGYAANNKANADDYAYYLKTLADSLQNHPALLAYDMYNEPHWAAYDSIPQFTRVKQEVCQYVGEWYDAIRSADQHHLITIGAKGVMDVMDVDPGVLKVDFISEHLYPHELQEITLNYNKQEPIDRLQGELYWLNNNLPMPWITGEMGFSADDIDVRTGYDHEPYVLGHSGERGYNDDLSYYARQSQQLVLDYGGSGYSWWGFENVHWYDIDDGAGNYQHNFYGLLHFGDPDPVTGEYPDSLDKPVIIHAFTDSIATTANGPGVKPASYYDPYLCGEHNINHNHAISGSIYDSNGNPVKDAYVKALNWLNYDFISHKFNQSWIYTFSDDTGHFEVIPYNSYTLGDDRVICIEGSAIGSETFKKGQEGPWTNYTMNNADVNSPIILNKSDFQSSIVISENVAFGITKNFKGGMSLTIDNCIISGHSDLTARNEINVNSEFLADENSEIHIYPSETFPDCGNYSYFLIQKHFNHIAANSENNSDNFEKEVEINFRIFDNKITIFPNPSHGLFSIKLNSKKENDEINLMKVYDALGIEICFYQINNKNFQIDLSSLPQGIYYILAIASQKTFYQKIIIN